MPAFQAIQISNPLIDHWIILRKAGKRNEYEKKYKRFHFLFLLMTHFF
jgi:hypothetical protein